MGYGFGPGGYGIALLDRFRSHYHTGKAREGEQEMRSLSRSTRRWGKGREGLTLPWTAILLICCCLVHIECQKSVMQGLPASRLGVPLIRRRVVGDSALRKSIVESQRTLARNPGASTLPLEVLGPSLRLQRRAMGVTSVAPHSRSPNHLLGRFGQG